MPSKKPGFTFPHQPFRQTLALVPPLAKQLRHTLTHIAGQSIGRREYNPAAFAPGPVSVEGERVVLLDDTWVTGATAVSAAGALLRDGATSVAILPLARMVDSEFWPKDHPYHHTTIGSMADLDAASLEDVKQWFRDKYGPNNAVLVIAGDVTAAEARPLVERYFGDIPAGPVNHPALASVPTLP